MQRLVTMTIISKTILVLYNQSHQNLKINQLVHLQVQLYKIKPISFSIKQISNFRQQRVSIFFTTLKIESNCNFLSFELFDKKKYYRLSHFQSHTFCAKTNSPCQLKQDRCFGDDAQKVTYVVSAQNLHDDRQLTDFVRFIFLLVCQLSGALGKLS